MPEVVWIVLQGGGQQVPLSYILALLCVIVASISALLIGIAVKRRMDAIAPPLDEPDEDDE